MKNLLTVALAAFLGAASYGAATLASSPEAEACGMRAPRPAANIAGSYDSNYGEVVLQQSGARITGSYQCCGGGTIRGYMRGNTINFTWQQPGATGQGVWTYKNGRLTGTWGYDSSATSGGAWNLAVKPKVIAAWRD